MKPGIGKKLAIAVSVLGIVTIFGAVVVARDGLLERWYIWRLKSKDHIERFLAAKKLGEMGSTRAIPELITLLRESAQRTKEASKANGSRILAPAFMAKVFGDIGPRAVPALARALERSSSEREYWRRGACLALGEIQTREAVRALIDRLEDRDLCLRLMVFNTLVKIGPGAREAIPALTKALKDPNRNVQRLAATALERIQESSGNRLIQGRR